MLLTVTLNPALDRTMTVPSFQAGFRHRATDTVILLKLMYALRMGEAMEAVRS